MLQGNMLNDSFVPARRSDLKALFFSQAGRQHIVWQGHLAERMDCFMSDRLSKKSSASHGQRTQESPEQEVDQPAINSDGSRHTVDLLAESEQRFRAVWDFASDAMALSTPDGTLFAANAAYYQLFGYAPEEVIGHPFSRIFPEDQRPWAQQQYLAVFQREEIAPAFEDVVQRADGTRRVVESRYNFLSHRGRRTAMLSIIRDITERKRAEEQLRANEERFRALLEHSADAISLLDGQGRRVYASPASARMVGYEPTEYVGGEIFGHIHPDDVEQVHQVFAALLYHPGESFPAQFRVRHKQGEWVWIEGTGTNLLDHPGVEAVVVNYRDITQRKWLEEAIRQSKQQLEVILENVADGVFVQDARGTVVYMNEAAARLWGYASAAQVQLAPDLPAQAAAAVQRSDMRDERANPFPVEELPGSRALRGEKAPQAVVQYEESGSQTRRWALVKARPIRDADGQVQLAVTIFSDITEAHEAEKRKDEFIGMASHELKTPITTLKGLTQLLKMKMEKQGLAEPVQSLARMETQIDRLTRLVNELLDVSKIQAGRVDYAEERIALGSLLRDIVETQQLITTTHTMTLSVVPGVVVLGDRDRLGQVFLNLLGNAIKYSPLADQVAISMARAENTVTVSVRDYGVGIPGEHQARIFDRFYRVSQKGKNAVAGLGIGLYISREIVNRHGGTLTVESSQGNGSTFSVTLPCEQSDATYPLTTYHRVGHKEVP
jgi:two-component system, OmpR family, phosphate regulon sensor histidine kinase PhoR